jgi:superoxide dismutase
MHIHMYTYMYAYTTDLHTLYSHGITQNHWGKHHSQYNTKTNNLRKINEMYSKYHVLNNSQDILNSDQG